MKRALTVVLCAMVSFVSVSGSVAWAGCDAGCAGERCATRRRNAIGPAALRFLGAGSSS